MLRILDSETRVMRINYASADSVAETLKDLVTPDRGQVVSLTLAFGMILGGFLVIAAQIRGRWV